MLFRSRGVSREAVQVLLVQVALFVFELSGSSLAAARRPPPFFTMVAEVIAGNSGAVALRERRRYRRREEEDGAEEELLRGSHSIYGRGQQIPAITADNRESGAYAWRMEANRSAATPPTTRVKQGGIYHYLLDFCATNGHIWSKATQTSNL